MPSSLAKRGSMDIIFLFTIYCSNTPPRSSILGIFLFRTGCDGCRIGKKNRATFFIVGAMSDSSGLTNSNTRWKSLMLFNVNVAVVVNLVSFLLILLNAWIYIALWTHSRKNSKKAPTFFIIHIKTTASISLKYSTMALRVSLLNFINRLSGHRISAKSSSVLA